MTKTRKTGESSRKAGNVSTDESDGGTVQQTHEIADMHWIESGENECFVKNNDDTEFDDDVENDGDTSTSFSLQECMNEFRARRIRRSSLSHYRQETDRIGIRSNTNFQKSAEQELINQNLCNKQQERECKPCQNGFCYCFTSDSGDGGGYMDLCNPIKHSRYYRRNKLECNQIPSMDNGKIKNSRSKERSKYGSSQAPISSERKKNINTLKCSSTSKKHLTAISSLETSSRDAPLIQIIQELRENCVISKVTVNKYKIESSQNKKILPQKKSQFNYQTEPTNKNFNEKKSYSFQPEVRTATAPSLENLSELDNLQTRDDIMSSQLEGTKKCFQCSEHRRSAGGQLLQKRLSNSQFKYKPPNIKDPPPKPPRSIRIDDDQCCVSSASTTASVREAERVVDKFLKEKGYNVILGSNSIENANAETLKSIKKNVKSNKIKAYPLSKLT